MLYPINPTHHQHRLQVEHVVFGDDAEHTNQPFLLLHSQLLSTILLRKPDYVSPATTLDSVAWAKIRAKCKRVVKFLLHASKSNALDECGECRERLLLRNVFDL